MDKQKDLFGEQVYSIQIEGNPLLAGVCRHILDLVSRKPELLDGETVGEIERKLFISIWLDNGLRDLIPNTDQRLAVTKWMQDPRKCIDPDVVSRARRYLVERDKIRLPAKAIQSAEQHRQRIARSVKS